MAILNNADVKDEELMTAFCGAEALINSRPLTYQLANIKDHIPLTPYRLRQTTYAKPLLTWSNGRTI